MRYLCLLYVDESTLPPLDSPEFGEIAAANYAATDEMRRAGVLVDSAPLRPVRAATTVQVRDGEPLFTDGPFAGGRWAGAGLVLLVASAVATLGWLAYGWWRHAKRRGR